LLYPLAASAIPSPGAKLGKSLDERFGFDEHFPHERDHRNPLPIWSTTEVKSTLSFDELELEPWVDLQRPTARGGRLSASHSTTDTGQHANVWKNIHPR